MTHILIIDDEKNVCKAFELFLGVKGFKVSTAQTINSGWKKIQKENPDLVLLDIMMPGQNAYSIVEKIKTDPKLKGIKVVYFTALSNIIQKVKNEKYKVDGVIEKPISNETLINKIGQIMKK